MATETAAASEPTAAPDTPPAGQLLPCLLVPRGSITPYVLTVCDPDRAADIGRLLTGGREVGRFREYVTWQGIA